MPRVAIASLCLFWTTVGPLAATVSAADAYKLNGLPQAGACDRVQVSLEVGGTLRVLNGTEIKTLKMSVNSVQNFDERTLVPLTAPGRLSGRTVRMYDTLTTNIKIDEGGTEPKIRDDRKLIVAEAGDDKLELFSPAGPLTRAELDLLEVPGGGHVLNAILPAAPQPLGGTWAPAKEVWGAILGLDAVSVCDVALSLTSVEKSAAVIDGGGRVTGAVAGVGTDIEIKCKALYDVSKGRLLQFAMAVRENRSIGHVGPGLDVVARVRWMITPIAMPPALNDVALQGVPLEANPAVLALEHTIPDRLSFRHSREWYAMNEDEGSVMLRWIYKGELAAQASVVALQPNNEGAMSLENFQKGVRDGLGKNFGDFAELGEGASETGLKVMRAVVAGRASDLPIQWHYLLAADGKGRSAMFTYTFEPTLAELFAKNDWEMVEAAELLGKLPNPNERPTPASPLQVGAPKPESKMILPPRPTSGVRAAATEPAGSSRRQK